MAHNRVHNIGLHVIVVKITPAFWQTRKITGTVLEPEKLNKIIKRWHQTRFEIWRYDDSDINGESCDLYAPTFKYVTMQSLDPRWRGQKLTLIP